MKKAYGIMPAMLTVWKDDQSFDEKGTERYVQWLLDSGVHAISVCGSTGENTAMSLDEQKRVIEFVVKTVAGQVPVFAGTGRYATIHTLELSKHAQSVGADGVMVILPYYFSPYKAAVMDHFRELSKAIDIPVMVYNNPWFAGYELTTTEVKQLVDEGIVHAIKAAHGDVNRVHDLKYACGDKLAVFYGHDYAAFEGFVAGADGWLSGMPAALPKQSRQLYDAVVVEKDVEKGRKIWNKFIPFVNYLLYDKNNGRPHWLEVFKAAVTMQGIPVGIPRKPLGALDDENKRKLEKALSYVLE